MELIDRLCLHHIIYAIHSDDDYQDGYALCAGACFYYDTIPPGEVDPTGYELHRADVARICGFTDAEMGELVRHIEISA